ncbi:hypothetical protein DFH11DRAFT_189937 [Phellopilus nigrolimitatus]|nr:hypothetical protein DFH11DRAFT_189937 [Phellopilus nigrolimitatus]
MVWVRMKSRSFVSSPWEISSCLASGLFFLLLITPELLYLIFHCQSRKRRRSTRDALFIMSSYTTNLNHAHHLMLSIYFVRRAYVHIRPKAQKYIVHSQYNKQVTKVRERSRKQESSENRGEGKHESMNCDVIRSSPAALLVPHRMLWLDHQL